MRLRLLCLLLVTSAGCESLRPAGSGSAAQQGTLPSVAKKQQEARPAPKEIVLASATEPVRLSKPREDDPLTLMAQCLERDDLRGAALHLAAHVHANPEQLLFRLQLAELYIRSEQPAEAKFHYERFAAEAQNGPDTLKPHLVTAHIKLVELAQRRNDRFGELFHRGVGLLLLVEQLDSLKDRDEEFCEEILCKSLNALKAAKEMRPRDPRVKVYLARVYERTGSSKAAAAECLGASSSVTSGDLTEAELKRAMAGSNAGPVSREAR